MWGATEACQIPGLPDNCSFTHFTAIPAQTSCGRMWDGGYRKRNRRYTCEMLRMDVRSIVLCVGLQILWLYLLVLVCQIFDLTISEFQCLNKTSLFFN